MDQIHWIISHVHFKWVSSNKPILIVPSDLIVHVLWGINWFWTYCILCLRIMFNKLVWNMNTLRINLHLCLWIYNVVKVTPTLYCYGFFVIINLPFNSKKNIVEVGSDRVTVQFKASENIWVNLCWWLYTNWLKINFSTLEMVMIKHIIVKWIEFG